jgi:hypothetical protein
VFIGISAGSNCGYLFMDRKYNPCIEQNSGNIYPYVYGARVFGNKNKGMKTLPPLNFVYIVYSTFQK